MSSNNQDLLQDRETVFNLIYEGWAVNYGKLRELSRKNELKWENDHVLMRMGYFYKLHPNIDTQRGKLALLTCLEFFVNRYGLEDKTGNKAKIDTLEYHFKQLRYFLQTFPGSDEKCLVM